MNILLWPLLSLCAALTNAIRIPLHRQSRRSLLQRSGNTGQILAAASGVNTTLSLNDVHDLLYIANVTLGGNDYLVQLDTGSSDFWLQGPTSPLPNSIQSSITLNLTYGIGWAFGSISHAPVVFAGIPIKNQAYLDVSSARNPALAFGAEGILGLGFTSLSTIDSLMNNTGSSTGRSILFNAFGENPNEPNFISFALPRTLDPRNEVAGAITIGEYIPQYQSIASTGHISTWPVSSPRRWNVLLDAILVGNETIPVSSNVIGAPFDQAVILLDTGTSNTYAPPDVCKAIYGDIPGAQFNEEAGVWSVPCNIEINMALQINNQAYPVHPLDVSPYNYPSNQTCVGSFVPQTVSVGVGEFDWLIGDNVLRSVYAVYDFGDVDSSGKIGDPYVQLLSIVDPNSASADFASVRGSQPQTNITYNVSQGVGGGSTVTLSQLSSTLDKLTTYIPVMLAIMALNALVIIILVVFGIFYLCRRRRRGTARKMHGRASPTILDPIISPNARPSEQSSSQYHAYEPVSMAFTEDTFVPPSPAFHKDTAGGKRHSSYQPVCSAVTEEPFSPSSPSFLKDSGCSTKNSPQTSITLVDQRPKSVA